jgi:hypothetical protein
VQLLPFLVVANPANTKAINLLPMCYVSLQLLPFLVVANPHIQKVYKQYSLSFGERYGIDG